MLSPSLTTKIFIMKIFWKTLTTCFLATAPFIAFSQVDTTKKAKPDSAAIKPDSTHIVVDTVKKQVVDTVVLAPPKDCYTVWYEFMRSRGAKKVTDGKQPVVIALKSEESCTCLMGQVEVVNGRIKPPLLVQQENGEFRPISVTGKKLDAAFVAAMGEEQLYSIIEGMSIVFKTASGQEYGRLFFYSFANKGAQSNKEAPSPSELIKE